MSELLKQQISDRAEEMLSKVVRKDASGKPWQFGRGEAPAHLHSRGEQPYSLSKAILSIVTRDKTKAPLEWSISEKLEQAGYAPSFGGLLVPLGSDELWRVPGHEQEIERLAVVVKQAFPIIADPEEVAYLHKQYAAKAMDPLDETLGGSLIALPSQGELITLLRPLAVVSRAGAQQIPLPPSGGLQYPKETGDPVFSWLSPNATITDTNVTTGALTLIAKRAAALIKVPNDLIRYARPTAEALLRNSLAQRAALTEDLAFLEGSGGTIVPQGIINYALSVNNTPTRDKITLHNATTAGANGDTLEVEDVLKMMGLVEEAPDPFGPNAWIMRPLMFTGLASARADAVSAADKKGPFLFPVTRGALGGAVEKVLAGLPVLTSTQVSKTRAKGTGSNLTYILCGNFREAVIGRVGAIELAASTDAGFTADQVWVRGIIRVDFGLRHPESFTISDTLVIPA